MIQSLIIVASIAAMISALAAHAVFPEEFWLPPLLGWFGGMALMDGFWRLDEREAWRNGLETAFNEYMKLRRLSDIVDDNEFAAKILTIKSPYEKGKNNNERSAK